MWFNILSEALAPLDSLNFLECDGMTRIISGILVKAGIEHKICIGYIENNGSVFQPHLWIDLEDGSKIDYRAQIWLGNSVDIPHGVFDPKDYSINYKIGNSKTPDSTDEMVAAMLASMEGINMDEYAEKLLSASGME